MVRTAAPVALVGVTGRHDAWAVVDRCRKTSCRQFLLRSDDGGRTWSSPRPLSVSQPSFTTRTVGLGITGDFDAGHVYVTATTDGGRSWTRRASVCRDGLGSGAWVSLVSPSRGFLLCRGQGGAGHALKAVYETLDGGRTWRSVAEVVIGKSRIGSGGLSDAGYAHGIAFASDGSGVLLQSRGFLYVTHDGGRRWRPTRAARDDVDLALSASVLRGGIAYVLVQRCRIRLVATTDGGRRWHTRHTW